MDFQMLTVIATISAASISIQWIQYQRLKNRETVYANEIESIISSLIRMANEYIKKTQEPVKEEDILDIHEITTTYVEASKLKSLINNYKDYPWTIITLLSLTMIVVAFVTQFFHFETYPFVAPTIIYILSAIEIATPFIYNYVITHIMRKRISSLRKKIPELNQKI